MNNRWRTILKCQEINAYLRQKHRMEKDFKCKSRGLRSLICYTSIKLENKVLSLHSILNQKDMPESNILLNKSENIALCQISKTYLPYAFLLQKGILIMFVTKVLITKYSVSIASLNLGCFVWSWISKMIFFVKGRAVTSYNGQFFCFWYFL